MKKLLFIGALVVGMSAHAAKAETIVVRPHIYAALDYFSPGNIKDSLQDGKEDLAEQINSVGVEGGEQEESKGALGARIGVLFPMKNRPSLRLGGSVGYVSGPTAKTEVKDADPSAPGSLSIEFKQRYLRALFEAAEYLPVSSHVFVKLGGGIGIANAETEQRYAGEGSWEAIGTRSKSVTGITWEVSPALVFPTGRYEFEIGARYAYFPTIKKSDETYEVKYSGLAFYAGFAF